MDTRKLLRNKTVRSGLLGLFRLVSVCNRIIPKQADKILLYDSFNTSLEDNTRALLLYMLQNGYEKNWRILCVMPRNPDYAEFSSRGIKTVGAVKGVFHYLTAKYFFTSFGNMRIRPAKGQIVVNQWHGTPLKAIGQLGGDHSEEDLDFFTYTLAASEYYRPVMAKIFGCSETRIRICGHARNDRLFQEITSEDEKLLEDLRLAGSWKKRILWMPTFRVSNDGVYAEGKTASEQETGLPVIRTEKDYERLNAFLQENTAQLVIKIHGYSASPAVKDLSNIRIISNADLRKNGMELYGFIRLFDVLLTDYSSVFFDYLLLDRPIGFVTDDFEEYRKDRGFAVTDPESLMPGRRIAAVPEMISFLREVLDGRDLFSEERRRVNRLVNQDRHGDSCEKLLRLTGILPG